MQALILDAEAHTARVGDIPKPGLAANELLIKVKAISLNPIDSLYVAHPLGKSGRTVGSDFAGEIVGIGSDVPSTAHLHEGLRVAGFLQGACSVNERPGAFAEYLTIPWDLIWRLPDAVSFEQAAGVSLVALTAAQGVWYRLGLKAPFDYDREAVLKEHANWQHLHAAHASESETLNFFVYGASTSVGLYVAQMARLSAKVAGKKIKLFGTASKARWDFLKAEPYSYDHLVDYRDGDWSEQVQVLSDGAGMHFAYDALSEGESVKRVAGLLVPNGKMSIVRSRQSGAWSSENLQTDPIYGAVWEGLGEAIQYSGFKYSGFMVEKSAAARDFAVNFYAWLNNAIGKDIQLNPIRLMPGGLSKVVVDGFELLGSETVNGRKGQRSEEWMKPISAEKLVYQLA